MALIFQFPDRERAESDIEAAARMEQEREQVAKLAHDLDAVARNREENWRRFGGGRPKSPKVRASEARRTRVAVRRVATWSNSLAAGRNPTIRSVG